MLCLTCTPSLEDVLGMEVYEEEHSREQSGVPIYPN